MEAHLAGRDTSQAPHRPSRGLRPARAALAVAVLLLAFVVVLPRLADYGEAWEIVTQLGADDVGVLALAGAWNLFTYWPVLVLALPGLTLREAAVVNQASTAVTNTLPAGSAAALGVTYRFLRAWGFTRESIANQILLTGLWNNFVKLGLPVVAVLALSAAGDVDSDDVGLAAVGLAVLVGVLAVGAVVLHVGPAATRLGPWLARVRRLVRTSGGWLSLATVVSHLSLFLMLLVSLRTVGVDSDVASWTKVLAAFAFIRLLSAIPITPGGVGVVELGYVGFLSAGRSDEVAAAVTAGVLLFRAITYVLPIVLGGLATLVFRAREDWRRPADTRGSLDLDEEILA